MRPGQERRRRRHDPRERHLREQLGVVQQAVGAGLQRRREVRPHAAAEQREREVRRPVDLDVGQAVEQDRERQRTDQRLDPGPGDAEERLLVAGLEVAEGEEVDELAVGPQLADPERRPAAGRRPR